MGWIDRDRPALATSSAAMIEPLGIVPDDRQLPFGLSLEQDAVTNRPDL